MRASSNKSPRRIALLAHNIRSLWNIGSFFRTADAFAVEKIILTGYTATPPRKEIGKTAIGADEWIAWEHHSDPLLAIKALKEGGWTIVALEIHEESMPLLQFQPSKKVCLVVGHEILGVPKELMEQSDAVVHIPMLGKKHSLNVSVAAGIALHHLRSA